MPRPRRCQVRADQQHSWVVAGEQFLCAECKEPGPDINEVLGLIWDIREPQQGSARDRAAYLHDVLVPRAQNVLFNFEDAAAVLEAELASEGDEATREIQQRAAAYREVQAMIAQWRAAVMASPEARGIARRGLPAVLEAARAARRTT
jgi:hypothetical protein